MPLMAPSFSWDARRPGERLLHAVDRLSGGVDIEHEIAAALQRVLLREVAQQRTDGDAGQRLLHCDAPHRRSP